MYHATLGIPRTLEVLAEAGCVCRHLEYDQYPEGHVYLVAQKPEQAHRTAAGLVRLRNVEPADLSRIYALQLDPESHFMAGTIPRSADSFDTHWAEALRDPRVTAKAVLLDEALIGHVACFPRDGQATVGYWIDREHWGQGIASRALHMLLHEVPTRPLFAHVAASNGASLRVLQKCGFVVERVQTSPACDRHPECEVAVLVLTQ
jgi:RimJ/RimL family protein N-acetyltransferase